MRSRGWVFTLNNPLITHEELLQFMQMKDVEQLVFQLEEGASGTPHFQGSFRTKAARESVELGAWQKWHLEPMKGTYQ